MNAGITTGYGDDSITNNGEIEAYWGLYNIAITTGDGDDVVELGSNSFTAADDYVAIDMGYDDDTVIVRAGETARVNSSTTCGNITVEEVVISEASAATVYGLIDGSDGYDNFFFSYTGYNSYSGGSGDYDIDNFENVNNSYTLLAAPGASGAARLYDDGVVLAFATDGGVAVCAGEAGFRAGTIDVAALDAGQTTFSANGWSIQLVALGGGQYEVHLFDGAGVEHFNDANGDGVADSHYIFTR
jgi:hypothetical protein